jgi:hypothetical protein
MTEVAARECPICGRWPANLRPAMRSAVWSLSLREWQCEECEEAFWANQIEASDRRRALAAQQRPQLFSCDSGVRRPTPRVPPTHTTWPSLITALWSRLTVENILTALWLAYFVGLAVMYFFPPV